MLPDVGSMMVAPGSEQYVLFGTQIMLSAKWFFDAAAGFDASSLRRSWANPAPADVA